MTDPTPVAAEALTASQLRYWWHLAADRQHQIERLQTELLTALRQLDAAERGDRVRHRLEAELPHRAAAFLLADIVDTALTLGYGIDDVTTLVCTLVDQGEMLFATCIDCHDAGDLRAPVVAGALAPHVADDIEVQR